MAKVQDIINNDAVHHELGHLFTQVLFSKASISSRKIQFIEFPLQPSTHYGLVKSEGNIETLNGADVSAEDILNVKGDILPFIVDSISGYTFEAMLNPSETFDQKFGRKQWNMNQDFQNVHGIKNKVWKHFEVNDALEKYQSNVDISNAYAQFIKATFGDSIQKLAHLILKLDATELMNADKSAIIIDGETLWNLTRQIESVITPENLKETKNWYEKIAATYSPTFVLRKV